MWSAYFNPRSPDGERRHHTWGMANTAVFQSTLPGWGATSLSAAMIASDEISIHAPRMGSDFARRIHRLAHSHFNPRSPDGERLLRTSTAATDLTFQSTLPGWGATCDLRHYMWIICISIHAPRMGSDFRSAASSGKSLQFQSTLPGWGATPRVSWSGRARTYFNPRSPDGERPHAGHANVLGHPHFNPRSPDGERLAHVRRRRIL